MSSSVILYSHRRPKEHGEHIIDEFRNEQELIIEKRRRDRSRIVPANRKNRNLFDYEPNDEGYVHLRQREHVCEHCSAKHYYYERVITSKDIGFYECCNSGKVISPPLR